MIDYPGTVSPNPDSAQIFKLASSWLKTCSENHHRCQISAFGRTFARLLPRRLVDVGSGHDPHMMKSHLVNTSGRAFEDMPYLTLSHCWGKRPNHAAKTTKGNVKDRMVHLSTRELSKTILDALSITQYLGFRYIWIDTLCVVQNSAEDWEENCARMATIYANSACTISASASNDDNEGCLMPRDPNTTGWMGIEFPHPFPSDYDLVSNRIICNQQWPVHISAAALKVILHPNLSDPKQLVEAGPLSQRGWALQERCLSPRILHFTEQQLVWECESTWSYECLPSRKRSIVEVEKCPPKHKSQSDFSGDRAQLYNAWYSIVREFSRAKLTCIKDQLPAISGLASGYLSKLPGETYLAGLWKNDLIRGLWWAKSSRYPQALRRPRTHRLYLAPSWSWASVIGPVFHPEFEPDADGPTVVEAKVSTIGLDPLGQVHDGVLRLCGRLKNVRKGHQILHGFNLPPPRALVQLLKPYTPEDVQNAAKRLSDRYKLVDEDMEDELDFCGQFYFDDSRDSAEQSLYCLRIAKTAFYRHSTIHVLVLVPTGGAKNQYRRVGIGEISRLDWFDDCEATTFDII